MSRVLSIISDKGGCGKSTLCINIAAALSVEFDRKVLILDLDAMACASKTLSPTNGDMEHSIGGALLGINSLSSLIKKTAIKNLFVVPGSDTLRDVDLWDLGDIPAARSRMTDERRLVDTALAEELSGVRDSYDFVFIDCPGGGRFMERSALMASDEAIIPSNPSVFDFYGLAPTIELVRSIQERRGEESGFPLLLGFIINGTTKAGIPAEMKEYLEDFGIPLFSPVRASNTLKSLPGWTDLKKRVLATSRPNSQVALSIRQVAREIDIGIEEARAAAIAEELIENAEAV